MAKRARCGLRWKLSGTAFFRRDTCGYICRAMLGNSPACLGKSSKSIFRGQSSSILSRQPPSLGLTLFAQLVCALPRFCAVASNARVTFCSHRMTAEKFAAVSLDWPRWIAPTCCRQHHRSTIFLTRIFLLSVCFWNTCPPWKARSGGRSGDKVLLTTTACLLMSSRGFFLFVCSSQLIWPGLTK